MQLLHPNSYAVLTCLSQNVDQPTIHVQSRPEKESHRLMPEKKERDLWWAFLAGKPESDWNPPKKHKHSSKPTKSRRVSQGMRAFLDNVDHDMSYERPGQETTQPDDEGEAEQVLTVDHTEPLPAQTCSPVAPETLTSASSSTIQDTLPPATTPAKAREPMPSLLKHIDEVGSTCSAIERNIYIGFCQRMALHILMYFAHWISLYLQQPDPASRPLEAHARWIFTLLSKVGDQVSADDMNLLRNLARACLGLLKGSIQTRTSTEDAGQEVHGGIYMSERSCWIIICIIVGVWAQRDLWVEAEDMLKAL